jgi:hypothetical protein
MTVSLSIVPVPIPPGACGSGKDADYPRTVLVVGGEAHIGLSDGREFHHDFGRLSFRVPDMLRSCVCLT